MEIKQIKEGEKLTLKVEGRIDTTTAPELFDVFQKSIAGVKELVIDLEKVDYVSSAGLRFFLSAQKTMQVQGKMVLKNVTEEVMNVFELTGFNEILTIE